MIVCTHENVMRVSLSFNARGPVFFNLFFFPSKGRRRQFIVFFFSSKTNQSLFSLVQDFNLLAALHEGMGFALMTNSICRLP